MSLARSVYRYVPDQKVLSNTNDIDSLDIAVSTSYGGSDLAQLPRFVMDLDAQRKTIACVWRRIVRHIKKLSVSGIERQTARDGDNLWLALAKQEYTPPRA